MRETIMEYVISTTVVETFPDVLAALSDTFAECTGIICSEHTYPF